MFVHSRGVPRGGGSNLVQFMIKQLWNDPYVYKRRGEGSQNMSIFFIVYKVENVNGGGQVGKKAKNLSTQFVNPPGIVNPPDGKLCIVQHEKIQNIKFISVCFCYEFQSKSDRLADKLTLGQPWTKLVQGSLIKTYFCLNFEIFQVIRFLEGELIEDYQSDIRLMSGQLNVLGKMAKHQNSRNMGLHLFDKNLQQF